MLPAKTPLTICCADTSRPPLLQRHELAALDDLDYRLVLRVAIAGEVERAEHGREVLDLAQPALDRLAIGAVRQLHRLRQDVDAGVRLRRELVGGAAVLRLVRLDERLAHLIRAGRVPRRANDHTLGRVARALDERRRVETVAADDRLRQPKLTRLRRDPDRRV